MRLLIAEGNLPEDALARKRAIEATAAESFHAALCLIEPEIAVDYAKPYFSDHDLDALDLSAYDGLVLTGSGVSWSAADEQARPFWNLLEKSFAAGTPVFGSCWGMQNAAVVLGGETRAGPNGVEAGFAREVRPSDHPLHQGRRESFDAICMHRDDVTRAPEGAVVTASNAHTAVQAMAYDSGEVSFWGVQYHPEATLHDISFWFSRPNKIDRRRDGREIARAAEDPAFYAGVCAKHRIGLDILDRAYHMTELGNWLRRKLGAA